MIVKILNLGDSNLRVYGDYDNISVFTSLSFPSNEDVSCVLIILVKIQMLEERQHWYDPSVLYT